MELVGAVLGNVVSVHKATVRMASASLSNKVKACSISSEVNANGDSWIIIIRTKKRKEAPVKTSKTKSSSNCYSGATQALRYASLSHRAALFTARQHYECL